MEVPLLKGVANVHNLLIQENTAGKDGQEYLLNFDTQIPANASPHPIPAFTLAFLFYNGESLLDWFIKKMKLSWCRPQYRFSLAKTQIVLVCNFIRLPITSQCVESKNWRTELKGSKFLKKLWCSASVWEFNKVILVLPSKLVMLIGHLKEFQSWSFEGWHFGRANDEGLTVKMSAWNPLRRSVWVINLVVKTKITMN